ncbi:MAG: hypothetical protein RL038_691 [Actinomycetota bacterium]
MAKLARIGAALLVLLSSFAWAGSAAAETVERISLYDIKVNVDSTGVVTFTERIVYNFGDAADKHGIYRYVPAEDELSDGSSRVYEVTLGGIALNGRSVPFEEYYEGSNLVWKIGDPDAFVSGTQIYEIQYFVKGALHPFSDTEAADTNGRATAGDYDFYWDVIGDGWNIPIDNVFVEFYHPGTVLSTDCYPTAGTVCDFDSTTFEASELEAFEPLTVSVWYPKDAFSVALTENIRPPFSEQFNSGLPFGLALAAAVGAVLVSVILRVRGSIRQFKIAEFVRFEVPENLRPAEIAVSMDGRFDSKDLTATLLDLATRGYLRVDLVEKDIQITKLKEFSDVADWELVLLKAIFGGQNSVVLDKYESRIEKGVSRAKEILLKEAAASGRRPSNINSKKILFVVTGVVSLLLFFPIVIGVVANIGFLTGLLLPVTAVGIVLSLIGGLSTPQQHTERSAEFLGAARGFRRALDTDAASDRREYAQKSGIDSGKMFATFLPFAVIFGLEKAWLAAHPEITAAAMATYGIYVGDLNRFDDRINDFTSAVGSSMTSPSSSSGGSSGGGGGGGGGGSW